MRLYYQRKNYGGDEVEYLFKQGGVCASCGSPEPRSKKGWHLDHCHGSKEIRAVLCAPCNVALGMLEENPTRVKQLLEYIEKYC